MTSPVVYVVSEPMMRKKDLLKGSRRCRCSLLEAESFLLL